MNSVWNMVDMFLRLSNGQNELRMKTGSSRVSIINAEAKKMMSARVLSLRKTG
jgi:hypothetical protein